MSEYEMQANAFLKKAETKMSISRTGEVKGFPFDAHDTLWLDFDWFCSEFGYECEEPEDEKLARKVYKACQEQYDRLLDLFGEDLMKDLQEIW